ncbi:MAG: glycosyltransferase [Rhizobacter sp.]|nr:glycosyltransferase [Rhizobacter sp.]
MTRPLVSIVIATYKSRVDHLSVAIASALNQSWAELEVIVSDDSPDDSLRRVTDSFRDARLRYRHNVPALGVARNHWASFGVAQGEFIAVLNHDDWLAPHFVERLADVLLREPCAAVAFCDHWVIDTWGRRLDAQSDLNSAVYGRAGLAEGMHRPFVHLVGLQTLPVAMGALFRRRALPAVLPDHAGPAYDLWLAYLLCASADGAWYIPQRLSAWRAHENSLSSQGDLAWLQGSAACWREMARDKRLASIRPLARRKAALGYFSCASRAWAGGRRAECLRFASLSLSALLTFKGVVACLLPLLPRRLAPARWLRGQGAA